MRGISCLAANRLPSQEGLSPMEYGMEYSLSRLYDIAAGMIEIRNFLYDLLVYGIVKSCRIYFSLDVHRV
jgi:hypothetical protein